MIQTLDLRPNFGKVEPTAIRRVAVKVDVDRTEVPAGHARSHHKAERNTQ